MKKKCPKCKSKDIHITHYPIPADSMATCYDCGYADLLERVPEQTVFDFITQSEEKLAEMLVTTTRVTIYGGKFRHQLAWCSLIVAGIWDTKSEAVVATIEELKKELKDESN